MEWGFFHFFCYYELLWISSYIYVKVKVKELEVKIFLLFADAIIIYIENPK